MESILTAPLGRTSSDAGGRSSLVASPSTAGGSTRKVMSAPCRRVNLRTAPSSVRRGTAQPRERAAAPMGTTVDIPTDRTPISHISSRNSSSVAALAGLTT
jgi:hypothetical protein